MVVESTSSHERTDLTTMIAIPAFNEEETIASVIAKVQQISTVTAIIVIDDGSSDQTGHVARSSGAIVLTLPFNVGVGGAMRAAFLYARHMDYDFVVQVDADGQHDPKDIPLLIETAHRANVVIGARFTEGDGYHVSAPRKLAMKILAASLSKVTKAKLTDTTSGFRVADKEAIRIFAKHYPAEYLGDTVESLVIAARAGLTVTQVPVTMHERQGGQASQSSITASLYLGRSLLALFVALTRGRRNTSSSLSTPSNTED